MGSVNNNKTEAEILKQRLLDIHGSYEAFRQAYYGAHTNMYCSAQAFKNYANKMKEANKNHSLKMQECKMGLPQEKLQANAATQNTKYDWVRKFFFFQLFS